MNETRSFVWIPRVLGILFAIFVSVFALDVLDAGYRFWEAIVALLMHLIPTVMVVIALAIAWRWEGIGAILFVGLALIYLLTSGGESWILTVPLLVIGSLFAVAWIARRQQKTRQRGGDRY